MKTPTDTRIDQLRQELTLTKHERDDAIKKLDKFRRLIVALVDSIADYFGRSNHMVSKLLKGIEDLR